MAKQIIHGCNQIHFTTQSKFSNSLSNIGHGPPGTFFRNCLSSFGMTQNPQSKLVSDSLCMYLNVHANYPTSQTAQPLLKHFSKNFVLVSD